MRILIERFGIAILFLAAGALASCGGGGGGGGADPVPGGVDSYSPFTVLGASDAPQIVTWSYVVNGGEDFEVEESGATVRLRFSDPMVVTYDPLTGTRSTDAPLSFTLSIPEVPGSIGGSGRLTNEEDVEVIAGETRITGSAGALNLAGTYFGLPALTLTSSATVAFDEPLTWFPDRDDLGTLDIGFVHAPAAEVAGTVTGSASLQSTLLPDLPETPVVQPFSAPQRWEIVDRLASVEVGGRTFTDVVVIDLTTAVPDLRDPDAPADTDAAIRMWFAKGIGMIKATGAYTIWESPLSLELLSTSLDDR